MPWGSKTGGAPLLRDRSRRQEHPILSGVESEPVAEVQHGMGTRLSLGVVACLAALATGCTSGEQVGQVKEVGQGTYTIGVSRTLGISQSAEAIKAAVDKAGEYCHSKGQKLQITGAEPRITFRCISEGELAPKKQRG
jgi:hypothetical protein